MVLAGTLGGDRRLGLTLATLAFLLFNFFFLPPYGTFAVADPLDWLVLATFLVVSTVAAQMLHRLQVEAAVSRRRAAEVDRFATLGAETLNVARADDALAAIEAVIRSTLDLDVCRIHTAPAPPPAGAGPDPLVTWVAESGHAAIRQSDGTVRLTDSSQPDRGRLEEAHGIYLPLRVRDRTVGVLEIGQNRPIVLSPAQWSFLTALTYYAALGVERARLTAEADRAEVLREADRLKDALIASVSHDLRTPLTTIKALAHEMAGTDDRAIVIEEEADRLNRMVADLLDLSRLQGGALPLMVAVNPVDDLVGALVQRVSGVLGGRELEGRAGTGRHPHRRPVRLRARAAHPREPRRERQQVLARGRAGRSDREARRRLARAGRGRPRVRRARLGA